MVAPANLPAWMREPLLHFVVLGAILFAVDHVIAARTDDPHTIRVDASVDQRERELFKQTHGREPNADELYSVRREWLDDEVLYREGIAMALDKGDPAIRSRVILKARGMIEASLQPPTFDPRALRDWFDKNRAKYDQPGQPAQFEKIQDVVLADWLDAKMAEQRSAALRAMANRYTVEVTRSPAASANAAPASAGPAQ